MTATLMKCQDLTLWTSLDASWTGLGKSRCYTSMSSKREGKIRIEIRSRRSKICLLLFYLMMESKLDILLKNNYIVCKVNFPSREVIECEE